jgi:L-lysine exporter family protein LysE/ArgO
MAPASDFAAAALEGFLLSLSLIVAIGAQNAFVLRQGLAKQYVFAVATICALSDLVLIAAGVAGLGRLIRNAPAALGLVTLAGAAFLAVYGVLSFRRALRPGSLSPVERAAPTLAATAATCLALTFLNPHVYLDTVVLIGALSARHTGAASIAFGGGAGLASILWFFGLAYGARLAAPIFARPQAWRVLDVLIGLVMLAIAIRLVGEGTDWGAPWP